MNQCCPGFIGSKRDISCVFQVLYCFLFAASAAQFHADIHQGMGKGRWFTELLGCIVHASIRVECLSLASPLNMQHRPDALSIGIQSQETRL